MKIVSFPCNELWFQIFFNLKLTDIIRLSFILRRINEIIFGNEHFKKYCKLSYTIINKSKFCDCFMKRFN